MVRDSGDIRGLRLSGAVALILAAAATVHAGLDVSGKSHLGVFWAKGTQQMGTLFERLADCCRYRAGMTRTVTAASSTVSWRLLRALSSAKAYPRPS